MKVCAFAVVMWAAIATSAPAQGPRERSACNACHAEMEFLRQNTGSRARAQAVLVADSTVARSAHGQLGCVDCHDGFARFPHAARDRASCASCHEAAHELWLRGAHAPRQGRNGVRCAQCHGAHDVASAAELKTRAGIAAMNRNCANCHQAEQLGPQAAHTDSALCSGCHAPHDTRPSYDRASRLWPNAQLQTCGTCHIAVAREWQSRDVHARALLTRRTQKGQGLKHRPPACTDCHGAHGNRVTGDSTLADVAAPRCTECHERYAGGYEDSYHGRAKELGSRSAATCADCHTAHSIQPADRAGSSINSANLIATCGRCHEGASAAFTQFQPHLDPHDAENPVIFWTYKFMTLLLFGTMSFFALHTLLWLSRLALEKVRKHD